MRHANAPIAVTANASGVAVGAVLEQLVEGSWQPLAFFSRQLRPAERKYSAFDCELLALYLAVRHFRYFLEGRNFIALTDLLLPLLTAHQLEPGVDFSAMSATQQNDPEMAAYCTAISGFVLQDVQIGSTGNTLLCDTSTGQPRPVVPASFRRTVRYYSWPLPPFNSHNPKAPHG